MAEWWKPAKAGVVPEIPWFSPGVISFLEGLLTPDMRVLEHGSGGSTLWLASRVKKVTSYETDTAWYELVKAKAPKNVMLKLHAAGSLPKITGVFDMLIIDGAPVEDRALWIKAVPQLVKPGGIVVLDNYNRLEYAKECADLRDLARSIQAFHAAVGHYLNTEFYFL